ncbi:8-oxo-dGTP pyrophosphatase MutT, NUDIX family [Pseudobacteriovorax antillogorgiicola]|uniref:8-oxo-dGTP pyrophosphatase MutT, NUDIX family n=2 Tax=Pseudobacteriovorax antillogorgiicola TaxID=1513793 RepID=A0A1Y6BV42_9BACT|nr:8-oxo-dGTP pyrophosphatase MutT (NUDIX family) [Pseudobacteriovorax antillogorgiicola]SMF28836.1 8-oxo-dGTP pyrophosphatase MutT, NUDIX family [Pseudobacteriovorax antillogorgiicola]
MDYVADPKKISKLLEVSFAKLTPVFEDDHETQTVRVYDVRGFTFDQTILKAVRSVFGLVQNRKEELLLVDHPKRGWEVCGGHLNAEEVVSTDIRSGLHREVLEESGHTVEDDSLAFLGHIHNKEEAINRELQCPYPQETVMAIFTCYAREKVSDELHDDIKQVGFFSKEEALSLVRSRNRALINAL